MSDIELLATLNFRMPCRVNPTDRRHTSFSIWRTDPVAFPVTEILQEALQSSGFRVDSPRKEGNGTYFRCIGDSYDIGVAVTIMGHNGEIVDVGLSLARLRKQGRSSDSTEGDLGVDDVIQTLTSGLQMRFVESDSFVVTNCWRRPS